MTPVPMLDASTTIQDASAAMLDEHVEVAIVSETRLRGLVTARDIAEGLGRDVRSAPVAEIARWEPIVVQADEPLADAHERMRAADDALAMVIDDDGRPVGVLADDGAAA